MGKREGVGNGDGDGDGGRGTGNKESMGMGLGEKEGRNKAKEKSVLFHVLTKRAACIHWHFWETGSSEHTLIHS